MKQQQASIDPVERLFDELLKALFESPCYHEDAPSFIMDKYGAAGRVRTARMKYESTVKMQTKLTRLTGAAKADILELTEGQRNER